jgi:hypothetical protein
LLLVFPVLLLSPVFLLFLLRLCPRPCAACCCGHLRRLSAFGQIIRAHLKDFVDSLLCPFASHRSRRLALTLRRSLCRGLVSRLPGVGFGQAAQLLWQPEGSKKT